MITRYDGTNKVADVTSGTYDSGWVDIEWTSDFQNYVGIASDPSSNGAQVRRIGNIIYLRGMAQPTRQLETSYGQTMCNLPERFRPDRNVCGVMQGNGIKKWGLIVYSNGKVELNNYGTNEDEDIFGLIGLPFDISYVAGDSQ